MSFIVNLDCLYAQDDNKLADDMGVWRSNRVDRNSVDLDHAGNDKLLNQLLLSLGCWLMVLCLQCGFKSWRSSRYNTHLMIRNRVFLAQLAVIKK